MRIAHDQRQPLVLFADDGAPPADVAWAWITSHDWSGWTLETLTVAMTLYPGGPEVSDSVHVSRQPPSESRFVSSRHSDVKGDPRVVIRGRSDAALIVVGCHHRGHLEGLLAGSTTEWLLGGPPVPVLVARHGHTTGKVAICVDGGPHARRAIEAFLSLPWSSSADVALLAVADGATDVDAALTAAMDAFPAECTPTAHPLTGRAKREIPDFVRSHDIDLVALGTRGLSGLSRLRMGSTVSALLKDARANLMVAHVRDDQSGSDLHRDPATSDLVESASSDPSG